MYAPPVVLKAARPLLGRAVFNSCILQSNVVVRLREKHGTIVQTNVRRRLSQTTSMSQEHSGAHPGWAL